MMPSLCSLCRPSFSFAATYAADAAPSMARCGISTTMDGKIKRITERDDGKVMVFEVAATCIDDEDRMQSRQFRGLARILNTDKMKYGGDMYDVFDMKVAVFFDACSKVGIKQPHRIPSRSIANDEIVPLFAKSYTCANKNDSNLRFRNMPSVVSGASTRGKGSSET
ncbi:hypothetical protein CH63R_07098 [Colletotrichum higginsianum IMI 349063]|uniref:Uncharacterized protein n=1 Tax=Colletotrichum higginsianum (strain IMI 349063) TaxID=759273 RepID=A0A1B7Y8D5_COLHI|nr:hypothetical protein CH63R_07098 [Colletotrichum higginsianum IMI 349063]OBR08333.1 hypothetical protein CH63R_07098 [Colletotrichum higginsianum IMI 349063]